MAFLRSRRVRYAIDRSNLSGAYLRNRLRNRLLPHLERSYNPSIRQALLRLSENLAEGWETLEKPVASLIPRAGAENISIPLEKIARLTDFQLYLLIDILLRERFSVSQDIERAHFDAAKRLIRSHRSGKQVRFPHGIVAGIEHSNLVVTRGGQCRRNPGEAVIPGAGSYALPWWNLTAAVERVPRERRRSPLERHRGVFRRDLLSGPRALEKAGRPDRPVRHEGNEEAERSSHRPQDPLSRRDAIPVFEDERGVFWLPGVAVSERRG